MIKAYKKMCICTRFIPRFLCCCIVAAGIALVLLPIFPPSIVLSSGNDVMYEQVVTTAECEVSFRHSANKGIVREIFRLDANNGLITLAKSYNENFGAGMIDTVSDAAGLNFRREGAYYVMDFPQQWKTEVNYIGGDIAGHMFYYQDDAIAIGNLRPREPFTISIQRRSLLQKLLRRIKCDGSSID